MQKNNGQNISLYIFECTMSVFYLLMSYILIFTIYFNDIIPGKNTRMILGIVLGIYGIFRVYRAVRKYKEDKKTED